MFDKRNTNHQWKFWCRLCAKNEPSSNVNIVFKNEQGEIKVKTSLMEALKNFFGIDINENMPKILCLECFSLTTSLINFSSRVKRVQEMYKVLLNSTGSETLEVMKEQFGLMNANREEIKVPQCSFDYDDSKIHIDDSEDILQNEQESGNNPTYNGDICELQNKSKCFLKINTNDKLQNEEGDICKQIVDNELGNTTPNYELRNNCVQISIKESNAFENENNGNTTFKKKKKISISIFRQGKTPNNSSLSFTYKCPHCPDRQFSTQYKLKTHLKVHLPPEIRKVVPCPHCDKKFSSKSIAQTHIKYIHTDDRSFICEECGVTMRTNAALKAHMLTHTDFAPHECKICKKGFKNERRLKNHMEIHDPYKHICAKCGLQLNSRATLSRHSLVHSDNMQHKCDYCGRAFKRAKALKNHLILHTGLKPYSCDFCDRTFANGSNCRTHKRKTHPEELAALEASGGGKQYTRNIPKLDALKAVTKTADNLTPVVSKRSGCFAFGNKPKQNCFSDHSAVTPSILQLEDIYTNTESKEKEINIKSLRKNSHSNVNVPSPIIDIYNLKQGNLEQPKKNVEQCPVLTSNTLSMTEKPLHKQLRSSDAFSQSSLRTYLEF